MRARTTAGSNGAPPQSACRLRWEAVARARALLLGISSDCGYASYEALRTQVTLMRTAPSLWSDVRVPASDALLSGPGWQGGKKSCRDGDEPTTLVPKHSLLLLSFVTRPLSSLSSVVCHLLLFSVTERWPGTGVAWLLELPYLLRTPMPTLLSPVSCHAPSTNLHISITQLIPGEGVLAPIQKRGGGCGS